MQHPDRALVMSLVALAFGFAAPSVTAQASPERALLEELRKIDDVLEGGREPVEWAGTITVADLQTFDRHLPKCWPLVVLAAAGYRPSGDWLMSQLTGSYSATDWSSHATVKRIRRALAKCRQDPQVRDRLARLGPVLLMLRIEQTYRALDAMGTPEEGDIDARERFFSRYEYLRYASELLSDMDWQHHAVSVSDMYARLFLDLYDTAGGNAFVAPLRRRGLQHVSHPLHDRIVKLYYPPAGPSQIAMLGDLFAHGAGSEKMRPVVRKRLVKIQKLDGDANSRSAAKVAVAKLDGTFDHEAAAKAAVEAAASAERKRADAKRRQVFESLLETGDAAALKKLGTLLPEERAELQERCFGRDSAVWASKGEAAARLLERLLRLGVVEDPASACVSLLDLVLRGDVPWLYADDVLGAGLPLCSREPLRDALLPLCIGTLYGAKWATRLSDVDARAIKERFPQSRGAAEDMLKFLSKFGDHLKHPALAAFGYNPDSSKSRERIQLLEQSMSTLHPFERKMLLQNVVSWPVAWRDFTTAVESQDGEPWGAWQDELAGVARGWVLSRASTDRTDRDRTMRAVLGKLRPERLEKAVGEFFNPKYRATDDHQRCVKIRFIQHAIRKDRGVDHNVGIFTKSLHDFMKPLWSIASGPPQFLARRDRWHAWLTTEQEPPAPKGSFQRALVGEDRPLTAAGLPPTSKAADELWSFTQQLLREHEDGFEPAAIWNLRKEILKQARSR